MLNRTCRSLGRALQLISTVSARLQSPNYQMIQQGGRSVPNMFENMQTRVGAPTISPNGLFMNNMAANALNNSYANQMRLARPNDVQRAAEMGGTPMSANTVYNANTIQGADNLQRASTSPMTANPAYNANMIQQGNEAEGRIGAVPNMQTSPMLQLPQYTPNFTMEGGEERPRYTGE